MGHQFTKSTTRIAKSKTEFCALLNSGVCVREIGATLGLFSDEALCGIRAVFLNLCETAAR